MTYRRITDFLPDVYRGVFADFFTSQVAEESAATCASCAMWRSPGPRCSNVEGFSRQTKCCTYYPELPNYLVGALLNSRSGALTTGRDRTRAIISGRIGVTPHGLLRPPKHTLLMINAPEALGRCGSLACPYYDQQEGTCAVHPFRNAVCCTWFCKYSAGKDGWLFWQALKTYLSEAQTTLTQYALHRLGWPSDQIIQPEADGSFLTAREADGLPIENEAYGALWRDWVGREAAFYRTTHRIVAALSRSDFEGLMGIAHMIRLDEVRQKHQHLLEAKLPNVLKRNPDLRTEKVAADSYVLIGYSPLDPLMASKRVHDMLDFFDGRRSNEAVCRLIEKELGSRPSTELVLSLYQLRVLIDATKRTTPG